MMYMGNFQRTALAGVIKFTSGYHEWLRWEIGLCCTWIGTSWGCAGYILGGGTSRMGDTLGDDVGCDTDVCINGVAWVLCGGSGVRWGWWPTIGGAWLGTGVGPWGRIFAGGDRSHHMPNKYMMFLMVYSCVLHDTAGEYLSEYNKIFMAWMSWYSGVSYGWTS